LFSANGVAPERLAMVGYGEHRPRADNLTEEGRNRNRRVVLIVLAAPGAPGTESGDPPADGIAVKSEAPRPIANGVADGPAAAATAPAGAADCRITGGSDREACGRSPTRRAAWARPPPPWPWAAAWRRAATACCWSTWTRMPP